MGIVIFSEVQAIFLVMIVDAGNTKQKFLSSEYYILRKTPASGSSGAGYHLGKVRLVFRITFFNFPLLRLKPGEHLPDFRSFPHPAKTVNDSAVTELVLQRQASIPFPAEVWRRNAVQTHQGGNGYFARRGVICQASGVNMKYIKFPSAKPSSVRGKRISALYQSKSRFRHGK